MTRPVSRALLFASCLLPVLAASGTALAQKKKFTLNADFDPGLFTNSVDTNPNDEIVLGPTPVSKTHLVWATNYLYGWVVRIDSLTGKQTSRFDSSLQFINGQPTGAPPPNEYCDFATTGNCPGRVAVDTNGDVWIINRAFGKQGSLSKFSGNLAHCIDRNNNGVIDTSFDANNDGQISVVAGAGEYFGQNDECILTTIKIGPNNVYPRGVAVDKRGKIWASTWVDGKIYRINPNEPVAIEASTTVGGNPYSLASGKDYIFVSNSSASGTRRVHIQTLAVQTLAACPGTYGVVGDPGGDIAWLGGYFTGNGVYKANFANNTCVNYNTGSSVTAVTLDLAGNVWACGYNTNTIHKISPAGVILGTYPSGGTSPHGMSIDFQGNLWVINHGPTPNVTKVNVNTGAIIGTYPLGGPGVPNADPYLYSDFTGVQIDRQAPYTYVGSWEGQYNGGADDIPWAKVVWNTEPQGAVPAETGIKMSVRAANSPAGLAQQPYVQVQNNVPFNGIKGHYVQVRADLNGPGFVTPVVSDVTVVGACDPVSPSCCVVDGDCNDNDSCTVDVCPVPGQACQHAPIFGCCKIDADCNDQNQCTNDTCVAGTCQHALQANCCNSNSDCDDGVFCTADLCSGAGGTCSHLTINGCCQSAADCDDGNACTQDMCPPNNLCQHTPTPGCCTKDDDCKEKPDDLCTLNTCDIQTGTCMSKDLKKDGCCNVDMDCNDGDSCTTDSCSGPGGTCQHAAKPGCCTPNDPQVGMPCDPPKSPYDKPPCKAGHLECKNGQLDCVGAVKPGLEICDGIDNDCNGVADNPGNCPNPGDVCLWGECVSDCKPGEFPCDDGYTCYEGHCVPITCDKVVCPMGKTCVNGICTDGSGGTGGTGGGTGTGGVATGGAAGAGGSPTGGSGTGGAATSGTGVGGSATGGAATGGNATTGSGTPNSNNPWGLATGGGGCRCSVPGDGDRSSAGIVAALAALALFLGRQRRKEGREDRA
jgi:MYXO-CTERM domain-containing protein